MLIYWLMFLLPTIAVLFPKRLAGQQAVLVWVVVAAFFVIVIGLRHEVGGDWTAYLAHFYQVGSLPLNQVVFYGDPGYYVLSWIVAQIGGGIYLLNVICGSILIAGCMRFSRAQHYPWLALAVAVPYVMIVVGMGYTRQSVALGFAMAGFVALGEARTRAFVGWILVAALFHKTAVLLIPIAALAVRRKRLWTIGWVGIAAFLAYTTLFEESAIGLWKNYVEAEMESEGALVRAVMNALPALALLGFGRRLVEDEQHRRVWRVVSILAIASLPLVFVSSTAVDRMGLYLIPLQLFVFGRVAKLAGGVRGRTMLVSGVLLLYASVLFTWLNFATHAHAWVPYRFLPLGPG